MERPEQAVEGNEDASQSTGSSSMDISPESYVAQQAAASFQSDLAESEDLDDVFLSSDEEAVAKFTKPQDLFEAASNEQQKLRRYKDSIRYVESFSAKIYQRIHYHSMLKMKQTGQSMKELFSQIQEAIALIEQFKESMEANLQKYQEKQKQFWLEWNEKQSCGTETLESTQAEQIQTSALAQVRQITQFLKDIYHDLMSGLHNVPVAIQEQVREIKTHIEDIHASFSDATSFQDLSSNVLSQNTDRAEKAKQCLDVLVEYLIENIPVIKSAATYTPSETFLEEEEEEEED